MKSFFGNGKLLLTGEYAILDGATGLALPTNHGQYFFVEVIKSPQVRWKSYDSKMNRWFEAIFKLHSFDIVSASDLDKALLIRKLFIEAYKLRDKPLQNGAYIETFLTFPNDWGLGSSSTLITTFSHWLNVEPYILLEKTLGGSGYDIACAESKSPILFQKPSPTSYYSETISFNPPFKENLFFVYSGQKQNSREGIKHYKNISERKEELKKQIDEITNKISTCSDLSKFQELIDLHEDILSYFLQIPKVKTTKFSDFKGSIKSLGAWGGDFLLIATKESKNYVNHYFQAKGLSTILSYDELIL